MDRDQGVGHAVQSMMRRRRGHRRAPRCRRLRLYAIRCAGCYTCCRQVGCRDPGVLRVGHCRAKLLGSLWLIRCCACPAACVLHERHRYVSLGNESLSRRQHFVRVPHHDEKSVPDLFCIQNSEPHLALRHLSISHALIRRSVSVHRHHGVVALSARDPVPITLVDHRVVCEAGQQASHRK